jgi:diadenosine tetraphosphate (Ap4A) HIT family hydrolase
VGQELDCPFCSTPEGEKVLVSELCYARWDKYPVTEGHLLIIPNRHVADYFAATAEQKRALWAMVDDGKKLLDERFQPDGYNVGINVGMVPDRSSGTATFI